MLNGPVEYDEKLEVLVMAARESNVALAGSQGASS
jgi:hypothetical protein